MKQKKPSPRRNAVSQTRSDIRSFFSSSPTPSARKPKSPFSSDRASFFGTPSTTAATPSPTTGTIKRRPDAANPTSTNSSSSSSAVAVTAVVSPSSIENSSRKLAEVNGGRGGAKSPQQPPASSTKRPAAAALPSGRTHKTPPPRPQAKEVISLTGSPTAANATANANASSGGDDSADTGSVVLLGVKQESNKENGGKKALAASLRARGLLPPLGSTTAGAAAAAAAARSMSSTPEMSGYFLEGPTTTSTTTTTRTRTPPPPTRNPTPPTVEVGGGGGGGCGEGQGGGWKNASGRYALPVGDVVVGRNSIHDSKPVNSNKLRMGIDKRDEGVSRSQATLRVCASSNRVLVTHRSAAVNGLRIFRWAGSPGLATDEKKTASPAASPASAAAKLPKAGKIVDRGQRAYLYPGDLIQLDGFRNPELSTCSYVLHPLPPGWCRPARGGGRPSSASASAATAATALARGGGGGGGSGSGGRSGTCPPPGQKALAADSGDKGAEASSPIIARRRASSPAGVQDVSAPRARAIYGPTGTLTRRESPAPVPEPGAFKRGEAAVAAAGRAAAAAATAGSLRTISAGAAASDGHFPSPAPVGKVCCSRLSPSPRSAAAAAAAAGVVADAGVGVGFGAKRSGTSPGVVARGCPSSESGASRTGAGRAVSSPADGDSVKKKLRMSPGGPLDAAAAAAAAAAGDGHDGDRDGVFSSPSSSISPSPASEELRLLSETSRTTPSPRGSNSSSTSSTAIASKKRPSPSEEKGEGKEGGRACPGSSSSKASRRGGACTPDRARGGSSSISGSGNVSPGEVVAAVAASVGSPLEGTAPTAGEVAAVAVAATESIDEQVAPTTAPRSSRDHTSAQRASASSDSGGAGSGAVNTKYKDQDQDEGKDESEGMDKSEGKETVESSDKGEGKGGEGASAAAAAAGTGASWGVGDFVVLQAQMSKGFNKLGGVARVLSVFSDDTYLVKLSLGGAASTRVSSDLLSSYTPPPISACRGRRSASTIGGVGGGREGTPQPDASNGRMPLSPMSPSSSSSSSLSHSPSSRVIPSPGRSPTPARSPTTRARTPSRKAGGGSGDAKAKAKATAAPPAVARLGDRARVLYDRTDWYMGTVVALHRGGAVTVRFDDGSDTRVTLAEGDAETCPDHELVAPDLSALVEAKARGRSGSGAGTSPARSRGGGSRGGGSRSGGGGSGRDGRPGRGRSGGDGARALGPGGRVLETGEGVLLTESRARALLETDPGRLVGLEYQEFHPGYGGWWKTFVTEVSSERIGGGGAGGAGGGKNDGGAVAAGEEAQWPLSVTVGQGAHEKKDGERERGGEGSEGSEGSDGPDFVYKRKTSVLLSRLRAWDKHREASWQAAAATATAAAAAAAAAAVTPARASSGRAKTPSAKARAAAADAAAVQAADDADDDAFETDTIEASRARRAKPAKASNPPPASEAGAVGGSRGRKAAARAPAAAAAVEAVGKPEGEGGARSEEIHKKEVVKASSLKRATVLRKKEGAEEEREQPTCPFCRCEFYATESPAQVDAHLASCSRKAAAAAEAAAGMAAAAAAEVGAGAGAEAAGSTGVDTSSTNFNTSSTSMRIKAATNTAAAAVVGSPMPTVLSNALVIGLEGEDLGGLVSAVEEMVQSGVRPTTALIDRAMQQIIKSRCYPQTEYLHRLISRSLSAYPLCWKPLNWSRFEEALQRLAADPDPLALNAHVAAVEVNLDCIEAHRRRQQQALLTPPATTNNNIVVATANASSHANANTGAAAATAAAAAGGNNTLPQLFLGAGGGMDGRAALKRCAKWAAKTWARRGAAAAAGDAVAARTCAIMSRALGEALEAFRLSGGGGVGAGGGLGGELELEGCQLVAVEMETHIGNDTAGVRGRGKGGGGEGAAAARCRAGLVRSLGRRPFCGTLASVLLQNMSSDKGGAEVERLKALLRRRAGSAAGGGGGGGGGSGSSKRGGKAAKSMNGCEMLLAAAASRRSK